MNKYRCLYRAVVSRWQKLGVWAWAIAYIGTILVFAGLYYAFPDTSWKGEGQMDNCYYVKDDIDRKVPVSQKLLGGCPAGKVRFSVIERRKVGV